MTPKDRALKIWHETAPLQWFGAGIVFAVMLYVVAGVFSSAPYWEWEGAREGPAEQEVYNSYRIEFVDNTLLEKGIRGNGESEEGIVVDGITVIENISESTRDVRHNGEAEYCSLGEIVTLEIKNEGYVPLVYTIFDEGVSLQTVEVQQAKDWATYYTILNPMEELEPGVIYLGNNEVLFKDLGVIRDFRDDINIQGRVYYIVGHGWGDQIVVKKEDIKW